MRLPKIYEHFRQGQLFTIDEAREKLQTTGNTLRKRLSELAARGYLYPIRQGLYRVCAADKSMAPMKSSPFFVGSKIAPFCYVGFKSALQLHAEEVPAERDTIYVVSPTKFNAFSFEGRYFFWCQSPEPYGLVQCRLADDNVEFDVLVTDFEKTIVDCLRRPAHSPQLPELIRLCGKIQKQPDLDKIMNYAMRCDISALFNRLGFFLERMQVLWDVPSELLLDIERKMSRKQTEWPVIQGGRQGASAGIVQPLTDPLMTPENFENNRWRIQLGRFSPSQLDRSSLSQ